MEEKIYRSPESNIENGEVPQNGWKVFRAFLYSIIAIVLSFTLANIVYQFSETFRSFGTDLPFLTLLAIDLIPSYRWLGYINCVILFAYIFCLAIGKWRLMARKVVKYSAIISLVTFGACIVSMYLPIFTIGSAI